jgi:DNA mismatch repair protein MutS
LREKTAAEGGRIQRTARALAQLDVLRCFAENAVANGYCRPRVDGGGEIRIVAGRHPVVERLRLEERFIPNDALLDTSGNRLLIITGPNMGGKSTYLRQVALITLMAQIGSFVPAKEAEIGVVDATKRSLIILDEIGRGTSTFDGLSIAWAVAEHIHNTPRLGAKTMFATHYHELTELALTLEGVKNFNVAAREHGEEVIFLRTVVPGPSDQSYGIQVGKLAGLPREVVQRARQILRNLERDELDPSGRPRLARANGATANEQKRSEESERESLRRSLAAAEKIRDLDPEGMTPLEALNALERLKKELEEEE